MEWVNVLGLVLDLVGAAVLSYGLFVSEKDAATLTLARTGAGRGHPQVEDRLRQSRNAKVGLAFLAAGFVLQIVAAWP